MSLRGAQIGGQSFSFEEGEVGTSGGSGCHVCARSLRLKATKARSKRSNCCLLSAFCSLKNSVRCLIDESFESILEISAACLARSSLQLGTGFPAAEAITPITLSRFLYILYGCMHLWFNHTNHPSSS